MFDDLIQAAAIRYNVPVSWIQAVIQTESDWNPQATGTAGEKGLMQISPATAGLYGWDFSQMYDPAANIDAGAHLLGDLRQSYGDDFRRVYSAYNSGNPDAWQTSSQVAANVERALDNLAEFEAPGTLLAGSGLIVLAVGVGYFLFRKRR